MSDIRQSQIASVRDGPSGVNVTRFEAEKPSVEWRVVPWAHDGVDEFADLSAFLRGCLADAYHVGRRDALHAISSRDLVQAIFDAPPCEDGQDKTSSCNYCKAQAVMQYLIRTIPTPH